MIKHQGGCHWGKLDSQQNMTLYSFINVIVNDVEDS